MNSNDNSIYRSAQNLQKTAYEHITVRRNRPWQGEEEVRVAWISALEAALGVHFDAERARKDCSYNNVIIEFKAPGSFNGKKSSANFKKAINERLLPYILREAKKSNIPAENYIGITTDGDHICFAQVRNSCIYSEHLIPFSEYAVNLVIQAIMVDTRRTVTINNLMADFSHKSLNGRLLMQSMADALGAELNLNGNSKIKMLFEEWRTLYGQVADMSISQIGAINQEISFTWNGASEYIISGRLFVIHSYNSLLIKLLAAEIVSAYGVTAIKQPAQVMAALLDDIKLLDTLFHDIERAGIFKQAGIQGFVEEVIFSWYIDAARNAAYRDQLIPALRRILGSLSVYRTDHFNHDRDVLRDLYQDLVPGKLRQSLGEFYTPDWLVDFTIEKAQQGKWLNKRILDPTCGSGAFLVAILRLIRKEAIEAGWDAPRILQHLCNSVWGFDLNPLAVQTARVNFLIEIADLLQASPGQILEIPVLLADAIYSPASDPTKGQEVMNYKIGSQAAGLDINLPSALALNRVRLDQVFAQMAEDVENNLEYIKAEDHLVKACLITKEEAVEWRKPLAYTYQQILNLHRQQWNGIWFRVVRNFFWSATAGHFDCIVGNPPWVRWSKLPNAYRERVKPTCESYGIFSQTKRHGGNELDISAMITYTTADKWLKKDGRLSFVIRGEIFKNPSSAGFRNFQLAPSNSKTFYLKPISVDDMKKLKPFNDALNHTVVAVFDKVSDPLTFYPVPYRLWDSVPGNTKNIPTKLELSDVLRRVTITNNEAFPVAGPGSPWAVLPKGRYKTLQMLSGNCLWTLGHKGITTDLNGLFFVPIIDSNVNLVRVQTRPEAGEKPINNETAWIEPTILYPLIKGASDFEACYVRLNAPNINNEILYTFVPNQGISKLDYINAEIAMNTPALARTKEWFTKYKKLLVERSTYRRQMKDAPFYAIYNVGNYTFLPWKVISPEMLRAGGFYAAVSSSTNVPGIGQRPYVPDHKIYFSAFDSKGPAYFLCGLLNTPMVREWIQSYHVKIQIGDIFKHMQLPEYDITNPLHLALSAIVEQTHNEHNASKRAFLVRQIESMGEKILKTWANDKLKV